MQKQVGKYLLVQEIGEGQFGKVYKAFDTSQDNKEVAVKVMSKDKVQRQQQVWKLFQSEIAIMTNLHHPNLLSLLEFLETGSNYYMVLPFCRDGDLEKRVKQRGMIPEAEAVFYLKQIMSGFVYLYKNKIMHRDFKLANVFLDGDQVIIGDFGFSKQGVDVTTTKLGTPFNMAPEIMFSTGRSCYTSKADLWAIGVAYYHMLYGRQPFHANTMSELQHLIVKCSGQNVRFLPEVNVSEESKNLIRSLLEFDPNRRMNWQQFFNHSVFEVHSPKANQDGQLQSSYFNTGLYGQAAYESPDQYQPRAVDHQPQYHQQVSPSNQYCSPQGYQQSPGGGGVGGAQVQYGYQPQTQVNPLATGLNTVHHGHQHGHASQQASNHRNFTAFVEQHFIEEKKVVNEDKVFSSDFEIPLPSMNNMVPKEKVSDNETKQTKLNFLQPLDIRGSFGNRNSLPESSQGQNQGLISGNSHSGGSSGSGSISGSGNIGTDPNEYLTHERNKYLFVLQASKQWKEIVKRPEAEQKASIMILLSLALCKKGMIMNEALQRNIQNRHDQYNIPGFVEFCSTQTAQKLLGALQEDQKSSVQFQNYLESKVNEFSKVTPINPNFLSTVRAQHTSEAGLNPSIESMLVHILHWMGGMVNKMLLNACATTHYALNTTEEFRNHKDFDWKGFTARLEASDESECMQVVRKYYNRLDELSVQTQANHSYGTGNILQQRLF